MVLSRLPSGLRIGVFRVLDCRCLGLRIVGYCFWLIVVPGWFACALLVVCGSVFGCFDVVDLRVLAGAGVCFWLF